MKDQPIDQEDRKLVQSWLDVAQVDDSTKCSVEFIRLLRNKLDFDRRNSKLINIDGLYDYLEFFIMLSCGETVLDQTKGLSLLLDAYEGLDIVGFVYNKWRHGLDKVETTYRHLAEAVLHLVGVEKRYNLREFTRAWDNGPCRAVLRKMDQRDMQPLRNFVRLIGETNFNPMEIKSNPNRECIPIIQSCEFLRSRSVLRDVWEALHERDSNIEEHVKRVEAMFGYYKNDRVGGDALKLLTALIRKTPIKEQSISDKDRNIVQSWIDVIDLDDETKCSVELVRMLKGKIEIDKQIASMRNVGKLYTFAMSEILSYCGDRVVHHAKALSPILEPLHGLEMVGFVFNRWKHEQYDVESSFKYLSELMLHLVGTDKRANQVGFINAWSRGPCSAVLAMLARPDMRPFANFVKMVDESSFDPFEQRLTPFKHYISMVQACEHFQSPNALGQVWNSIQERNARLENHVRSMIN